MNKGKLIDVFREIQNIPYHISVNGEKGFDCEDKAKTLAKALSDLGIEAETVVALFRWSELDLPEVLTRVPHEDESSHMFVRMRNTNGAYIYIDPTWNPELKSAGFDIAEWDGESSTDLAIPCYKIFSPDESAEYLKKIDYSLDEEKNGSFYQAFNEYCDSFLREKK